MALEKTFYEYAKFGATKSDGKEITLSNSDKWMKEAGIIDGKKVTTTDTGICFSKFKSKTLDYKTYLQYIEALAKEKKLDPEILMEKMKKCQPSVGKATTSDKSKIVERMTDVSKYTGSHKERFDEKGKGKGKSGREDEAENSGYVQGYKEKDTYDERH